MFDVRPMASSIVFTYFGSSTAVNYSKTVLVGDCVSLRLGDTTITTRVSSIFESVNFTGIVEEIDLPLHTNNRSEPEKLKTGQIVEFTESTIYICTKGT